MTDDARDETSSVVDTADATTDGDGDIDIDSSGIALAEDDGADQDSSSQLQVPAPDAPPADADADEEPPAPRAATPTDKSTKKDRGTRRVERLQADIDRLTAIRTKTRQEVEELEAAKRALASPAPSRERRSETATADASMPAKPKWKDFEAEDKDFDDFLDALDGWNEQRLTRIRQDLSAEAETRARDRVAEERLAAHQDETLRRMDERMARGRTKYPDWDDAATALDEIELEPDLRTPDFVRDLILHHEQGDDIIYHLSKHPEVADALTGELKGLLTNSMMTVLLESSNPVALVTHLTRHPREMSEIAMLSARTALVRLTRLDSRLSAGANDGSPAKPKPVSHAPPPPSHRAGGHRTAGATRAVDDESPDAYIARREREERDRRRSA